MPTFRYFLALLLVSTCGHSSAAGTLTTIYNFSGGASGYYPNGVAFDNKGNIYGAATAGGACKDCGLIYRLKRPSPGQTNWTYEVIHLFLQVGYGKSPTAPVTFKNGSLYGTTSDGASCSSGCGTIFKLTEIDGHWVYKVLHRFGSNQFDPDDYSSLTVGDDGTIYGTRPDTKILFKLTRDGSFTILHKFTQGQLPESNVLIGSDGALYGTERNGSPGFGSAFRFSAAGEYETIHSFNANSGEGTGPLGQIALGEDGTIYGTTEIGARHEQGAVWSLTPPASAGQPWGYKQLFNLPGTGHSLISIRTQGVVRDDGGRLYGTSNALFTANYHDVIFKLAPSGSTWEYKELAEFPTSTGNAHALSELTLRAGVLYGTTVTGNDTNCPYKAGCGTVFSYKLP